MAKQAESPITQETKDALDEVKQGKARKGILIYKGSTIVDFIAFKKGPYNSRIQKAKKAGSRGVAVCGILGGKGEKLVFKMAGNSDVAKAMKVGDTCEGEPTTTQKLKKFLADANIARKPEYETIYDKEKVAGLNLEDGEGENAPAATHATGAPDGAASDVLKKAAAAWDKALDAVDGEIKKLQKAIVTEFKGVPESKKLVDSVKQLDGILDQMDKKLSDKLKVAASTSDADQAALSRQEALDMIAGYKKRLKSDPLLSNIDKNPFKSVNINKTLDVTLSALGDKLSKA